MARATIAASTLNWVTTISPTRYVELDGVSNFRDLGGYRARDGRTTKWRTMFRADGLSQLTTDDIERIRPLELRTVVDLRTSAEIDERGRFPVDAHPVTFHHLSIIDQTCDLEEAREQALPPAEFLHRAYTDMLATAADRFAAAITLLADAEAVPAVFHCAAGKDRTGLLAALVLGALGVDRDTIVADYALTENSMDLFLARAAADPVKAAEIARVPRSFFSADPLGMDRVLADVERDHATVRDYVRSIGVTDPTLDHLDALLLTN
ncbi:tyrosine-protein phosphatase [soil metagenome]